MSDIPKCGICDFFTGLVRRFMCVTTRRGSSDTYYRELGDQETLHAEDDVSEDHYSYSSNEIDQMFGLIEPRRTFEDELRSLEYEYATEVQRDIIPLGKFYTSSRKKRRRRPQDGIPNELTLLDDCYPKQVELLLARCSMWDFDTHDLDRATGGNCIPVLLMHFFTAYGLIDFFKLVPEKCMKLFNSIEENYHENSYHNSIHAADVTQAVHCFLQQPAMRSVVTPLETLMLLLAAITHDLDHPGVNHSYLVATKHPLAIMYKDKGLGAEDRSPPPRRGKRGKLLQSLIDDMAAAKADSFVRLEASKHTLKVSPRVSPRATPSPQPGCSSSFKPSKKHDEASQCDSVLEHHHWRVAYSCILQSGIFDHIPELLPKVKQMLKSLILATDITRQNVYLDVFREHLERRTLDLNRPKHRFMVLQMALKTADISNPGRPWPISRKWSLKVCDEFYLQGDLERNQNLVISNLCDRTKDTVPRIQTGFFRFVVSPLFNEWNHFLNSELSHTMLMNLIYNDSQWSREDQKSKTTSELPTITDADQVLNSLETSTNLSLSSEMLITGSPSIGTSGGTVSKRESRRSSYSPVNQAAVKDAIRRYSAPLHMFIEPRSRSRPKKGSISECRLREEIVPAAHLQQTPSPKKDIDHHKHTSMLEITMMVTRDRSSEPDGTGLQTRGQSLPAVKDSANDAVRQPPCAPAELIDLTSPKQLTFTVQSSTEADTDEDSSSSVKRGAEQFSVVLEESSSSSASQLNGSTAPTATVSRIPMVSLNSVSAPSSESRLNRPHMQSDKFLSNNLASSCELMTFSSKAGASAGGWQRAPLTASRRRGSAPAPSVHELQRLASTVSLQPLSARTKHAACSQRIAGMPALARRGSLPIEVMSGIQT